MSVGIFVSALHRIKSVDMTSVHTRPAVQGENPLNDALLAAGIATAVPTEPIRFRSPTIESIVAWRERLASKYRDQLGEELTWDERSNLESSDDVWASGLVTFCYTAAVLDQRGQAALGSISGDGRPPPREQYDAAHTEASRRGFGGRFPQLLLGAYIWLPFERNLMIEEPDWDGGVARYGSVFRLVDEITTVRAGIADADPSVTRYMESDEAPQYSLAAAWQTSATILRLAMLATARHLPLRMTG
jgi:hypothetical protein